MKDDQEALVGHLLHVASKLAIKEGLDPGYRIVINDGLDACIFLKILFVYCSAICISPAYSCYWRKEMWMASCVSLVY